MASQLPLLRFPLPFCQQTCLWHLLPMQRTPLARCASFLVRPPLEMLIGPLAPAQPPPPSCCRASHRAPQTPSFKWTPHLRASARPAPPGPTRSRGKTFAPSAPRANFRRGGRCARLAPACQARKAPRSTAQQGQQATRVSSAPRASPAPGALRRSAPRARSLLLAPMPAQTAARGPTAWRAPQHPCPAQWAPLVRLPPRASSARVRLAPLGTTAPWAHRRSRLAPSARTAPR